MANKITYEEALAKAKNPNSHIDIRHMKRFWTDEFLEAALNTGNAVLAHIPKEKITLRMAEIGVYDAKIFTPPGDQIHFVPKEYLTPYFLCRAVSNNPSCFGAAFYHLRMGREFAPYTEADIRLCMEALCPQAWGNKLIANLRVKPELKTEQERNAYILKQAQGLAKGIPNDLIYEALCALVKNIEKSSKEEIPSGTTLSEQSDIVYCDYCHSEVIPEDDGSWPTTCFYCGTALGPKDTKGSELEADETTDLCKAVIFRSEGNRHVDMLLRVNNFDDSFLGITRDIVDRWYETEYEEFIPFVTEELKKAGYTCSVLDCEFFDD